LLGGQPVIDSIAMALAIRLRLPGRPSCRSPRPPAPRRDASRCTVETETWPIAGYRSTSIAA
jgi:hypothetical protein